MKSRSNITLVAVLAAFVMGSVLPVIGIASTDLVTGRKLKDIGDISICLTNDGFLNVDVVTASDNGSYLLKSVKVTAVTDPNNFPTNKRNCPKNGHADFKASFDPPVAEGNFFILLNEFVHDPAMADLMPGDPLFLYVHADILGAGSATTAGTDFDCRNWFQYHEEPAVEACVDDTTTIVPSTTAPAAATEDVAFDVTCTYENIGAFDAQNPVFFVDIVPDLQSGGPAAFMDNGVTVTGALSDGDVDTTSSVVFENSFDGEVTFIPGTSLPAGASAMVTWNVTGTEAGDYSLVCASMADNAAFADASAPFTIEPGN